LAVTADAALNRADRTPPDFVVVKWRITPVGH
jgi:hypothetical protein